MAAANPMAQAPQAVSIPGQSSGPGPIETKPGRGEFDSPGCIIFRFAADQRRQLFSQIMSSNPMHGAPTSYIGLEMANFQSFFSCFNSAV